MIENISELENSKRNNPKLNTQRKKKTLVSCCPTLDGLIYVKLEFPKEKGGIGKNSEEIKAKVFPTF